LVRIGHLAGHCRKARQKLEKKTAGGPERGGGCVDGSQFENGSRHETLPQRAILLLNPGSGEKEMGEVGVKRKGKEPSERIAPWRT